MPNRGRLGFLLVSSLLLLEVELMETSSVEDCLDQGNSVRSLLLLEVELMETDGKW